MSLLLNVNYEEKDEAKAFGAKWNSEFKKWYVTNRIDYPKFSKWILRDRNMCIIVCDYFYIVEGKHRCFKCGKETEVIGFGFENYYQMYEDETEYCSGEIHIASGVEPLSSELLRYLKEKYNFYLGYSKTTEGKYYSNHCKNCNILQGDFYLFDEVDSPFFIDSIERAKNLNLYKVNIKNDLILDADIGYGSEDYLIKEYGKIHELNINFNL